MRDAATCDHRTSATQSSKNISRVVFDAGLLQHGNEFLFKRHFLVVPFLVLNVSHHPRKVRFAHPEPAISFLPGEPADLVGHPAGRVRFDGLDGVGNHHGGRKLQQHMNVVFHPADGMDEDALMPANARRVRPQAVFHFDRNDFAAVFGAEDDMHYVLKIGVRQGVAPPGLAF